MVKQVFLHPPPPFLGNGIHSTSCMIAFRWNDARCQEIGTVIAIFGVNVAIQEPWRNNVDFCKGIQKGTAAKGRLKNMIKGFDGVRWQLGLEKRDTFLCNELLCKELIVCNGVATSHPRSCHFSMSSEIDDTFCCFLIIIRKNMKK